MKILPNVKKYEKSEGFCHVEGFLWHFAEGVDQRVKAQAHRICDKNEGTAVYVCHDEGQAEGYTLKITENEIKIHGKGAPGAFYGLTTLNMLWKRSGNKIEICEINDAPDMSYRGFYQDTTRGRIPTLPTLKRLVDKMAEYKLNSLQLYVEHSYEFKEYEFCRDRLGCLTKAEIKELDEYCKERFIELIPSLSTFGHLYHLLEGENYRHLCELDEYTPKWHYYLERMRHHTINPCLDESFELVKSLIDQHIEAFSSDKFNICCDETFDLANGVNKGKDKGELYLGFVKKLVSYLESKGKSVMMWGDIVLEHADKLADLPKSITFLNWTYSAKVNEARVQKLAEKRQIVCPGTSAWLGFHECVNIEEPNILSLVKYGKKHGALGVLNTNWGDIGNPASVDMGMYGLILGAAVGWDNDFCVTDEFKDFVCEYHYNCPQALTILTGLSETYDCTCWLNYTWDWFRRDFHTEEGYREVQDKIKSLCEQIEAADFADPELRKEFLIAAKGDSFVVQWSAAREGFDAPSPFELEGWLKEYEANWFEDSKRGELYELLDFFKREDEITRAMTE